MIRGACVLVAAPLFLTAMCVAGVLLACLPVIDLHLHDLMFVT
jgi:hypothetical protein